MNFNFNGKIMLKGTTEGVADLPYNLVIMLPSSLASYDYVTDSTGLINETLSFTEVGTYNAYINVSNVEGYKDITSEKISFEVTPELKELTIVLSVDVVP